METATLQTPSYPAILELIRRHGLQYVEFWFTDLSGKPWRISMAAPALTEDIFRNGLPLDGQPVGGAWNGVMLLVPQAESLYVDPTASIPTLAMICDVLAPAGRRPLPLEPRHVLAHAQEQARKRLGAEVVIGAEPEFTLFDGPDRPACENEVWDFLRGLASQLGGAGIQVDWFRTGPAAGQGRVQMRAGPALLLADRVMLYRHFAAHLAGARGQAVSFLPRPAAQGGIPGMPVHHALWKDGVNLFHDEAGWAATSELCRRYAAGLLAHLPALLAFCAPTTNSYRRLIPGVCGPTEALLSATLRTAACRIPARDGASAARRVKFCCCDSTANPYLAFAAAIMAGLDGIERRLECPVDGDPDGPERGLPAPRFPHSLESALEDLSADRDFLTASGAFSDAMIAAWIKDRWERHVVPVRSQPHPWELAHADIFGRADKIRRDGI
ncbi:MAG: glutamine synthetase beta-grasp domain-containing protein [Elusimicrobia bacterium]|nr:glutamine synthetase beta-grasp domain-containing protein [Elusimicrobiota bacterium]